MNDTNIMSDWYIQTNDLSIQTKYEVMTLGSGESEEIEIMGKIVPRKKLILWPRHFSNSSFIQQEMLDDVL